jgi:hypothetical protein
MEPQTEEQNGQNQERRSEGGVSRGINIANSLTRRGSKNPLGFGKTVARVAIQAGSKFAVFLFTTPAGWVTLGVGIVVFFTVVVIISVGAPPMQTNGNTVQTVLPTATQLPPAEL